MPELPEVETARRVIADHALGRRIVAVDDADTFVCRPHSPGQLAGALAGRELTAARRRGKTMWCETSAGGTAQDSGGQAPGSGETGGGETGGRDAGVRGPGGQEAEPGPELGIHLGMGGRILVTAADGEPVTTSGQRRTWTGPGRRAPVRSKPAWDRFTLEFADGGQLVLFDKRRLGRVRLDPDVSALGPDAEEVTRAQFRALITAGRTAVKARLLNQAKIAGVGNLLADETLWQAKISPAAPTAGLSRAEADRLHEALQTSLAAAIAGGGVHTGEMIRSRRTGGTCPRCGAPMQHGTVGGRSTWWCSREQA